MNAPGFVSLMQNPGSFCAQAFSVHPTFFTTIRPPSPQLNPFFCSFVFTCTSNQSSFCHNYFIHQVLNEVMALKIMSIFFSTI